MYTYLLKEELRDSLFGKLIYRTRFASNESRGTRTIFSDLRQFFSNIAHQFIHYKDNRVTRDRTEIEIEYRSEFKRDVSVNFPMRSPSFIRRAGFRGYIN